MRNTKQILSTLLVCLFLAFFSTCSKKSEQKQVDAGGNRPSGESSVANKAVEPPKEKPAVETSWLFPVKQDTKWGYIDNKGKLVIALQYDEAGPFSEGLAAVRAGKKWGYIDKTGNTKVELQFKSAGEFSEGVAFVLLEGDEKKSTKASTGGLIALSPGSSGRLESKSKDNKGNNVANGGYIDQSGKMIILPRFCESEKFSEGLALVCLKPKIVGYTTYLTLSGLKQESTVLQTRKIGYIDKSGNLITPTEFDGGKELHSGMAPVMVGKKWGFLDKTGKMAIEPQFDVASELNEGLAAVKVGNKWGFVDSGGKLIINAQFDDALNFSAGLAPVKARQKWGYSDKTGTLVITPQFDGASSFAEDVASIEIGRKWGFIDKTGKIVINPQFENKATFSGGLAEIKTGNKSGYIDKSGALVWPVAKQ